MTSYTVAMVLTQSVDAFGRVSQAAVFSQFSQKFASFRRKNNDVEQGKREERCVELFIMSIVDFSTRFNAFYGHFESVMSSFVGCRSVANV